MVKRHPRDNRLGAAQTTGGPDDTLITQSIRLLLLLPLAPAMWVLSEEAGLFLTANIERAFSNWAVYAFFIYILFYPLVICNMLRFWETLEHELTHAIFAYLCFMDVQKLEVHPPSGSGRVSWQGIGPSTLIYLAPYCVPLLALPPLLVKWLAFPDSHGALDLLIGLGLAFHFAGLARELSAHQSDIWGTGLLVAMPVILFANLLLIVIALGVILSDYAALESYFSSAVARIPTAYEDVMGLLDQGLRWMSSFE